MALTPPKQEKKSSRVPLKASVYPATCIGIYGIGTHEETYQGETKSRNKVILNFEVKGQRRTITTDDGDKRVPYTITGWYTFSYYKKATLAEHLSNWRGTGMSKEEENDFDLFSMLGKNCLLTVTNKTDKKGNIVSDKIGNISGLMDGMEPFESELTHSYFSFIDHGREIPDDVPPWIVKQIQSSKEWGFMEDAGNRLASDEGPILEPEFMEQEMYDDIPY